MLSVGGVLDPAGEEDKLQEGHTIINEAINDLQRLQERLNTWRDSRTAAPQLPPRPQLKVIPPRPQRECEDGRVKGELEDLQVQKDEIAEVVEEDDENEEEGKRDERQEELPIEFRSGQDQIQEVETNRSHHHYPGETFSIERETYLDENEHQTNECEGGVTAQRELNTRSETPKVDAALRPAGELLDDGDVDKHAALCSLPKPESREMRSSLGEPWECKRCTFHNKVEKKVCEMCFCSFVENGIGRGVSSPTSSPKPATQSSQPDSPTRQHSPLTTRQTEPGFCIPVPAPASAPPLSAPRSESSRDGRYLGTRRNRSGSEQTLPIESLALPVASLVSNEDRLAFSNIPIPMAIPELPTEFRGLLLLQTSSRKLFTKWKVVFVTLQGSLLMIHEPCTNPEMLNPESAIKSFRLHPFIFIENEKYHDKVHFTEKVKATSSSTRVSKKRDMGSVYSTRLFENPEHLVKKDSDIYNSFEFCFNSKCVPHSLLVKIAAFDSRVLKEFMIAIYRKVSQLRSAKLEERLASWRLAR